MPADFEEALARVKATGRGRVVRKKVGRNQYITLVKDPEGRWHRGEVKTAKGGTRK